MLLSSYFILDFFLPMLIKPGIAWFELNIKSWSIIFLRVHIIGNYYYELFYLAILFAFYDN